MASPTHAPAESAAAEPREPWYAQDPDRVIAAVDSDAGRGLSRAEAAARLSRYGPNQIAGEKPPSETLSSVERGDREEAATDPELAHAYIAEKMMGFSVEVERFIELGLMVIIGGVVSAHWREMLHWSAIWPVLLLFIVARPVGSSLSLIVSSMDRHQRVLSAWLGLRGVGAFYYLLFTLEKAGSVTVAQLMPIVLCAIVLSVLLHGATATVLLDRYLRKK